MEASYLMSTEAAATTYWTDLDLEDPVYDGYEHTVATLPDDSIDDGSSRAYLLAWIASHLEG